MDIWEGNYNLIEEAMSKVSHERKDIESFEDQMFHATKGYWNSCKILEQLRENSVFLEACLLAYYKIYNTTLCVADVGGGCGMHLIDLINSNLWGIVKQYYLFEDKKMSDYANRMESTKERSVILSGFPNNIFPDIKNLKFNLMYLNCSFQYILPTENAVEKMREFSPELICIDRALIGQIQTFYTVQKNIRQDIVAKFMNELEFLSLFQKNGYEIAYKYEREFKWNMDNFDDKFQLIKLPTYVLIRSDQAEYKEAMAEYINGYLLKGILFYLESTNIT